ncbi:MAG: hypothetical protein ABI988_09370 [Nitrospirota bacterium]
MGRIGLLQPEFFRSLLDLIPNAAAIHQLGAKASWIVDDTQLFQARLLRAKRSLDNAVGGINDPALWQIIDSLDEIEKAYGAVDIAPRSKSTSKKQRAQLELLPVVRPVAPDQRRSIEFAAQVIKDTREFSRLLPVGDYTLADQSFTVIGGTEHTGKKRINVRWNN